MSEQKKMTVREMIPNLELMFKARIECLIVYANPYMDHVPDLGGGENGYCDSVTRYEPTKIDETLSESLKMLLDSYSDCEVTALTKSLFDSTCIGMFVHGDIHGLPKKSQMSCPAEFFNPQKSLLEYKPEDFIGCRKHIDKEVFSIFFYVNDEIECRGAAIVSASADDSDDEVNNAVHHIYEQVPEFSDPDQHMTECVIVRAHPSRYTVHLGFNNPEGEHFSSEMQNDLWKYSFRENFMETEDDAAEFAPGSDAFVKPEDWQSLID